MSPNIRLVVIGASAGGMEPLLEIIRGLPAQGDYAVLIVQHFPAHADSRMAAILAQETDLTVRAARHELPIEPLHVYCAQPNHHLLVEQGRMLLTRGPRENHWRPSIDALFRSAAFAHRRRVIGVILSGALNDGTSGLWNIKHYGGTTIVQDRREAAFPDMPDSAARYVEIDHELPARRIPIVIQEILSIMKPDNNAHRSNEQHDQLTALEIDIAKGKKALGRGVIAYGRPSSIACPECHGALTEYEEGTMKRYRCHTGHAHTAESLLSGIDENVEKSMWEVMRGIEESQMLSGNMAEMLRKTGQQEMAAEYRQRAAAAADRARAVKNAIMEMQAIDPLTGRVAVATDEIA